MYKNKIGVVDIKGGFGNQLFQISFAKYLMDNDINIYLNTRNFERSKNLRYESFSRTQVSLQDATETFGQQVLTTQLAVRRFINQVFQPKLLKTARRWETLQHNFSIHCEHVLNQINYVWWCQNGLRSKVKMQKAGHSS